jgi:Leucine-rich repeat (LRR) protein
VDDAALTDEGLIYLAGKCPHLRAISLRVCHGFTDRGLTTLAKRCAKLEVVDLTGMQWMYVRNRVTSKTFTAFCRNCPLIHTFDLRLCSAFQDMGAHLTKLVVCLPAIKNLFLSSVEFSDLPSYLGHLKKLEFLQLCDNNMSVFCFKKLLSALLSLKSVHVSPKFLEILKKEEKK